MVLRMVDGHNGNLMWDPTVLLFVMLIRWLVDGVMCLLCIDQCELLSSSLNAIVMMMMKAVPMTATSSLAQINSLLLASPLNQITTLHQVFHQHRSLPISILT